MSKKAEINLGTSGPYSVTGVQTFDTPDGGGYNAVLRKDGKIVAKVHEAGHGGCPEFSWKDGKYNGKMAEDFEAYAKTLPPVTCECWPDEPMEMDGEMLIARLVQGYENKKFLKRKTKSKIFFRKPDMAEGEWSTIPLQGQKFTHELAEKLRERYGQDIFIANEALA